MKNIFKEWVQKLTREQISYREVDELYDDNKEINEKLNKLLTENQELRRTADKQMKYIAAFAEYLKVSTHEERDDKFISDWEYPREKIVFKKR